MNTFAEPARTTRPAKIITFYSYMGGDDRTMAVANIACLLAAGGKSVLIVDWNLDAPGLHLYFQDFLPDPDLTEAAGLLDMFHGFSEAAGGGEQPLADLSGLYEQFADLSPYAVNLDIPFTGSGRLEYVGPGRIDEQYAERVRGFHWSTFYASEEGQRFLEVLRTRLAASPYDYVLIDSRTGWCDGSDICTLALPDLVVLGLGMHTQAIRGTAPVARRIRAHHRGIRLHALPMAVPVGEDSDRLKERMHQAQRVLGPLLDIGAEDSGAYWEQVQVPYLPVYAYGERLAFLTESPRQPIGVLPQYLRAVRRITDGRVTRFDPVRLDSRSRLLDRVRLRSDRADCEAVSLLYAPHDQMWAEWIGAQLRQVGIEVHEPPADEVDSDALPDNHAMVVLLSANVAKSPVSRTVERLAAGAPVSGGRDRRLIGVRLDNARLPEHLDWPDALYLAGQGQEGARAALLAGFGLRAKDHPAGESGGLRFPDHWPSRWHVGVRNVAFTGRITELAAIRAHFAAGAADARGPLVLTGMGGVGKTQIALEYVHRFASQYDLVWWIQAGEASSVRTAMAELAEALYAGDSAAAKGDAPSLLEDLRRGERCPSWLLVFDDAPRWEAVEGSVPTGGAGHVLITSRSPEWTQGVTQPVGTFEESESLDLLAQRLPDFDDADLLRVARRVGHLPIAENAAAGLLATGLQSVEEFVAEPSGAAGDPNLRHFTETYLRAYDDVKERFPAAAKLLDLCAFLSPDGIGLKVVQSRAMLNVLTELDPQLESSYRLRVLIHELAVRAMAETDPRTRTLTVHRMLQELLRERMSPREQKLNRAQVLSILASMAPTDIERDDPEHRPILAELDRHLEVAGALDSDDPAVLAWTVTQVRYRWFGDDWDSAIELGERVLTGWRERFGPEATCVLRMESQVAPAYRNLGRFKDSFELSRHAATVQRNLSRNDPYALIAQHGYAADLRATGNFDEALLLNNRTYHSLVRTLGDDHYETLNASNNLALSKFYSESVTAALRQDQTTFETRRRVLGDRHPLTWHSYTNLGGYQRELWRLDGSDQYLREARDRLNDVAGTDAAFTLRTLSSLGMTWIRRGELQQAMQLLQDTHAAMQRKWGDTYPGTLACRLALAAGLHSGGRSGDAADYTSQVLGRYAAVWGEDHPFTAVCRSNLALYLLDSNEPERALDCAGQAVRHLRDALGRDHRYTLTARINLNNCAARLGKAREMEIAGEDQEILLACRADHAWGPHHPVTLIAGANLAVSQPDVAAELRATPTHDSVARLTEECAGEDVPLALALAAVPYRRLGFDLEVWGV